MANESIDLPATINRTKLIAFLSTLAAEGVIGVVAMAYRIDSGLVLAVLGNLTALASAYIGFTASHDARVRTELVRAETARLGSTGDIPAPATPVPPPTGSGVQRP